MVILIHKEELSESYLKTLTRFIPPEDFNLALLTLELEFVKKGAKDEQVDANLLSQQIRKKYMNQGLRSFYHLGNLYAFGVCVARKVASLIFYFLPSSLADPVTRLTQYHISSSIKLFIEFPNPFSCFFGCPPFWRAVKHLHKKIPVTAFKKAQMFQVAKVVWDLLMNKCMELI